MEKTLINQLKHIVDLDLISFHMPGHKLGKIYNRLGYLDIVENIYKMDTTEIYGTDNLHSPEGVIKQSLERASKVFNSTKTYYLINGSTCGIQAAIMSVCQPKDKIIVNRDCHQSVINSCILGDIEPIYIIPKIDKENNIGEGVDINTVLNAIDMNLDAKAILLTYPTYYGRVFNLEQVCNYANERGIVVIVDEAHGSHLGLSNRLPKTALEQGADIVIQSTHKTLPSFTQSSMLHIKGDKIDLSRLESILKIIESSSPSYILMSSLEVAIDIYDKHGKKLMDELLDDINNFVYDIKDDKYIEVYNNDDKTKIFISLKKLGITGYKLDEILRNKYNIQVELSNYYGVLLICTIGNSSDDFMKLSKALRNIMLQNSKQSALVNIKYPISIPKKVLNPRDAFYSTKDKVNIYESIGKISGEYIIPYPPGISLISPGEVITKEVIDYIKFCKDKGMNVTGIKDSNLEFIDIIRK